MTKIILKSTDDLAPKFELLPAGAYPCRCYQIIDLGTRDNTWEGVTKKRRTIRFSFEFPTKTLVFNKEKGEQPYVLSKTFTYSLHSKGNLRPFLESWRGKPFSETELSGGVDMDEFLGKAMFANVGHSNRPDGEEFATIMTHMPLPEGMTCPEANNELLSYTVDAPDPKVFDKLSKYTQELILDSDELSINTSITPVLPEVAKPLTSIPKKGTKATIDQVPF